MASPAKIRGQLFIYQNTSVKEEFQIHPMSSKNRDGEHVTSRCFGTDKIVWLSKHLENPTYFIPDLKKCCSTFTV